MRVELIYSPGCVSYKKALSTLETVIAEERLPLHVEMVEAPKNIENSPRICIDGQYLNDLDQEASGEYCRIFETQHGHSAIPCIESVRAIVYRKWKELTEAPLLGS